MKEFKSFVKRAATIFLAIAIICTSSGFDQLTTIAAETSELPAVTTEQPAAQPEGPAEVVAPVPQPEAQVLETPATKELGEGTAEEPAATPDAETPAVVDPTVVDPTKSTEEDADLVTPSGDELVDEEVIEKPVEEGKVETVVYKVSFVGFEGADLGTVKVEDGMSTLLSTVFIRSGSCIPLVSCNLMIHAF